MISSSAGSYVAPGKSHQGKGVQRRGAIGPIKWWVQCCETQAASYWALKQASSPKLIVFRDGGHKRRCVSGPTGENSRTNLGSPLWDIIWTPELRAVRLDVMMYPPHRTSSGVCPVSFNWQSHVVKLITHNSLGVLIYSTLQ